MNRIMNYTITDEQGSKHITWGCQNAKALCKSLRPANKKLWIRARLIREEEIKKHTHYFSDSKT